MQVSRLLLLLLCAASIGANPKVNSQDISDIYFERVKQIMTMESKILHGGDVRPYLEDIAQMRISMFREFPYLYAGYIEYEREYLENYFKSDTSTILLVFDEGEVVAFSSSILLADELDEIKRPFLDRNLPVEEYLYIGEMMIKPEYRGKGLLRKFFESQESYAKQNGYQHAVFMTVKRDKNHPARPIEYKEIDPIWRHFGYERMQGIFIAMPWQRVDTGKEEMNYLDVWYKDIM